MAYLGEYDKLCMLGKGAFATIWKVRHTTLGYVRAIKVSKEDVDNESDKAYQTFLKECRVLLQIGNGAHPNIVRIYQPRLIENRALVEMDYVRGCTLHEYLQQNPFMTIDEVMRFVHEMGGALAYCHRDIYEDLMDPTGDHLQRDPDDATRYVIDDARRRQLIEKYRVIHNDLHSHNVMRRDYDGSFVLLDFGLAIQDDHAVKSSARQDGALEYKAPEKWEDEHAITTQSDVYSLGILIYEALTGRVPFVFDPGKYNGDLPAKNDMYHKHRDTAPPAIEPLRRAAFERMHPGQKWVKDYPDWLEAMVMKCLAKNPEDRYADASELVHDFDCWVAHDQEHVVDEEKERYVAENEQLRQQVDELNRSLSEKPQVVHTTEVKTRRVLVTPPWTAMATALLALAVLGAVAWAYFSGFKVNRPTSNAVARVDTVWVNKSDKAEKANKKSKEAIKNYEAMVKGLEQQNEELRRQLAQAQSAEQTAVDNSAELSQLKTRVASLNSENVQLRSSVSQLQAKNKKLQSQVDAFIKNLSN